MRELRVEASLGVGGLQRGVSQAKSALGALQSQLRMTGKNMTSVVGFDSVRAGVARLSDLNAQIGTLNKTAKWKTYQELTKQFHEAAVATRKFANAQAALTKAGRENALHWRNNPPPIIRTGIAGLWQRAQQRMSGQGGTNQMLATMAGYFGGGRMGGLGGALGGLGGAAGWGAAIGVAIGAIMSALRKLFDVFKNGLMDLISYANQLQAQKAITGMSYGSGAVVARAGEMGGLETGAMEIWFSRFQSNLGAVEKTGPKVSNALQQLGLNLMQIRQMHPDDLFKVVLERMSNMTNINDRNAVGMALFYRQGTQLTKVLMNWKLSKEQIGSLGTGLEKVAWVDNTGRMIRYGDALAYLDKTISGLNYKKRGFMEGFFEQFAELGVLSAKVANAMPANNVGKIAAQVLKVGITAFSPVWGALFNGLNLAAPWLAKKVEIPKADEARLGASMGPLLSFSSPYGKGPGDHWSKIGMFSTPGVMNQFSTGVQSYHEKVVDKLTQIAENTRAALGGAKLQKFEYPNEWDGPMLAH